MTSAAASDPVLLTLINVSIREDDALLNKLIKINDQQQFPGFYLLALFERR